MTPDETIAQLRADLSQIESEQINALGMIATLKSDLARENERADRAEAGFTAAHIRAGSAEVRADTLEKELAEAIVNRNHNHDEAWRFAADRDSHQRLAIAAETRLAALQARADGLDTALADYINADDWDAGLEDRAIEKLAAYRAFTAEGHEKP